LASLTCSELALQKADLSRECQGGLEQTKKDAGGYAFPHPGPESNQESIASIHSSLESPGRLAMTETLCFTGRVLVWKTSGSQSLD